MFMDKNKHKALAGLAAVVKIYWGEVHQVLWNTFYWYSFSETWGILASSRSSAAKPVLYSLFIMKTNKQKQKNPVTLSGNSGLF